VSIKWKRCAYSQRKGDEEKEKDKKGRNEDNKHGAARSIPVKQVLKKSCSFEVAEK
jgi:hypothetical protein